MSSTKKYIQLMMAAVMTAQPLLSVAQTYELYSPWHPPSESAQPY